MDPGTLNCKFVSQQLHVFGENTKASARAVIGGRLRADKPSLR